MDVNKGLVELLDGLRRESGTEIEKISRDRNGDVPLIVIDKGRQTVDAAKLVADFEKTQPAPFRRTGTYLAADVDSLLRWMGTHADADAPVFGVGLEKLNGEWRNPSLSLIGVGNYSTKGAPAWHDFNVRYNFPVAFPWTIWAKGHSDDDKPQWFEQGEFAEFIENRIHELSEPARGEELSEAVTRFLEASGKKDAASPAVMFKMSRELKVMSGEKLETKFDLQSGETKLQYSQEYTGPGGHPLKIPSLFYIRIPVFFGQMPVLIGVKLRYRASGGKVLWSYALFAPDMIVAEEFQTACAAVTMEQRPLYLGTPERV